MDDHFEWATRNFRCLGCPWEHVHKRARSPLCTGFLELVTCLMEQGLRLHRIKERPAWAQQAFDPKGFGQHATGKSAPLGTSAVCAPLLPDSLLEKWEVPLGIRLP